MTRTLVTVADGVRAVRVDAPSPLPDSLDALLGQLLVTDKRPYFAPRGTRLACTQEEHDYFPWLSGIYAGLDLRLARCQWCGTVQVRDVSLDRLPGLTPGSGGPRRRDVTLGWYAGARPGGRTYS